MPTMKLGDIIKRETNENKVVLKTNGLLRYSFPDDDVWNSTSISMLNLSTRSESDLKNSGIKYLGQLVDRLPTLHGIRNLGAKAHSEIVNKLFQYYMDGMSDEEQIVFILNLCAMNEDLEVTEKIEDIEEVA